MEIVNKIQRILRKPPRYILHRVLSEAKIGADRIFNSRPDKRLNLSRFLKLANAETLDGLWDRHRKLPFAVIHPNGEDIAYYTKNHANSVRRILSITEKVLQGKIDLLGTGEIYLGQKVSWNKDYKTGVTWKNQYYRDINYVNFQDKSDVKIPWEISRMQWLIPLGQAYILTGEEKYANFVKEILEDWIAENTYAHSVNWTCTMEVALRIIVWEWFFHVFSKSRAWAVPDFRFKFLKSLYLHSFFTERNLEKSDINGNHYVADGAGLVFAGLFFKGYKPGVQFLNVGLNILTKEIELQVFPDGVDYEASVPYHRLVTELFFFPALFLANSGFKLEDRYVNKIVKMADFVKSYIRHNGSVPLFGDADDARTLPMGLQSINDHDYLATLIGLAFNKPELITGNRSTHDEIFWVLGSERLKELPQIQYNYHSKAFPDGGFYIMGNADSHIFIDCGPVGLAGRGGHGHNDLLSFEALIQGEQIVSDCGAYLYTADYVERNAFRSTSYHNTPMIDGEEINRFISPNYLWNLKNDALHKLHKWESNDHYDVFKGSHSGYERLEKPVTPIRTIILKKSTSELLVSDNIKGIGTHIAEIPLHLYPGVEVKDIAANSLSLVTGSKRFKLFWRGEDWSFRLEESRVSPSYGVVKAAHKLVWLTNDAVDRRLTLLITEKNSESHAWEEMDELLTKVI
jgi:uncharacterized heparinase superfamily protein